MTSYSTRIADYAVLVDDRFGRSELDATTWLPYYLPQWAGRSQEPGINEADIMKHTRHKSIKQCGL